jgi:hypothetical protein
MTVRIYASGFIAYFADMFIVVFLTSRCLHDCHWWFQRLVVRAFNAIVVIIIVSGIHAIGKNAETRHDFIIYNKMMCFFIFNRY